MKLGAEALVARLARGIRPLYVLCGDEPLLVNEALDLLREGARAAGCSERLLHIAERGFDWNDLRAGLAGLSLFSSRRLIELRLPSGKPGDEGARFLAELAQNPAPDDVVVIILPALEPASMRSRWAEALQQHAEWIDLKVPDRRELPRWLQQRLVRAGLQADDEALELLASRVEGNLLAAMQEIDKLALLAPRGRVGIEAVREAVSDGARFDIFQLADAALARDLPRTLRVLQGLQREGEAEVLVLWSLAREMQTLADVASHLRSGAEPGAAMNAARVWRSRQDLVRGALRGRSPREVVALLRLAACADRIVKGARPGDPWRALTEAAMRLAGSTVPSVEVA